MFIINSNRNTRYCWQSSSRSKFPQNQFTLFWRLHLQLFSIFFRQLFSGKFFNSIEVPVKRQWRVFFPKIVYSWKLHIFQNRNSIMKIFGKVPNTSFFKFRLDQTVIIRLWRSLFLIRSSCSQMFFKICVLKSVDLFTGNRQCWSLFLK